MVGHELFHGFDLVGGRWDALGNTWEMRTPKDKELLLRKAARIQSELRAFNRSRGLPMPEFRAVNEAVAEILKDFPPGPSRARELAAGALVAGGQGPRRIR